jgi:hypothetical protein
MRRDVYTHLCIVDVLRNKVLPYYSYRMTSDSAFLTLL